MRGIASGSRVALAGQLATGNIGPLGQSPPVMREVGGGFLRHEDT
jgi:hypothetical protein